jgi:hypothetical protein
MERFKCALALRDGTVLLNPFTENHARLATLYGLPDENAFLPRFAKIQFSPVEHPDGRLDYLNFDAYSFVDEWYLHPRPIWFDAEREEQAGVYMRRYVQSKVVDSKRLFCYGDEFIVADGAHIQEIDYARGDCRGRDW